MSDLDEYLKKLAYHTQTFIVRNDMKFGKEEYFEVISNICIVEDLLFRNNLTENDSSKRMTQVITERYNSIFYYLLAAEKLLPCLYYDNLEFEVNQKLFNWTFEANAKEKFILFNKKYFDLDVSKLIESYF